MTGYDLSPPTPSVVEVAAFYDHECMLSWAAPAAALLGAGLQGLGCAGLGCMLQLSQVLVLLDCLGASTDSLGLVVALPLPATPCEAWTALA